MTAAEPIHDSAKLRSRHVTMITLGGIIGASLGLLGVVAASLARDWTTTINPTTILTAPLVGLATGAIAGLLPAIRAARTPAAETLRS